MLGNVDQYRVTRELPLPYHLSREPDSSDGEDEDELVEARSKSRDGRSSPLTSLKLSNRKPNGASPKGQQEEV